jgi:hypothetical protein
MIAMTTKSSTSSTTSTLKTIPAGDLQQGFTISIPYLNGRFEEKTVSTVEITKGLLSDIANVTFTDGSAIDFCTANPVIVIATVKAEPVITLTVTADQKRKINQALHTHIDAAVKAVRKARRSGDSLAERLCFSDLTVAICTLRAVDPSVGDHFTAEWLIGGAR